MLSENLKTLQDIENRYYFKAIKEKWQKRVDEFGEIESLNYLTEVMQDSKDDVEMILRKRVEQGKISDADQARKTVAGNGFQGLVAYSLIKLQGKALLPKQIVITLKPKRHPLIDKYASIKVGDEIQKPDIDLLLYSSENTEKYPIVIYSIKTSLRERAGQTYRWKLLMDIATSGDCDSVKERYGLQYHGKSDFKVGIVTTNFYDEIMNPQQQGMLKFFDFVYLSKPGRWEKPVVNLSEIVKDLNRIYSGEM